jgi:hypothetical protein
MAIIAQSLSLFVLAGLCEIGRAHWPPLLWAPTTGCCA